jgi:hypothetical protein
VALCARLAWFVQDEPALDACFMIRRIGAFVQLRRVWDQAFVLGGGIHPGPSPNHDTLIRSAIIPLICGWYRLSGRQHVVEKHFDSVSEDEDRRPLFHGE